MFRSSCGKLAGAALLLSVFSTATAQADYKIAYVDMQKALQGCDAGRSAQKQYEAEVKRSQSKIDEKKADYEKLQKSYSKQKDSLSEKARQDKEEELLTVEKELKRSFQDTQETLRRRNAQIVGELVEQLRKVVEQVGEDEGYTMILEKGAQSLLYADSKIDVTDEVVRRFNSSKR